MSSLRFVLSEYLRLIANLFSILQFEGSAIVGKPLTVHAILDNPIPRTLTRCYFLIEGPGLTEPLKVHVKR